MRYIIAGILFVIIVSLFASAKPDEEYSMIRNPANQGEPK
jgi:hypothetical protein